MIAKTYRPAGRCIYCGKSDEALSREHIIPFALGGTLILPKSSCVACSRKTQKIEEACLHSFRPAHSDNRALGFFKDFRTKTGMQSRNPKPSVIQAGIHIPSEDRHETRPVDVSDFPLALFIPTFSEASFIAGKPPQERYPIRLDCYFAGGDMSKIVKPGEGLRLAGIQPGIYAQMLAKIAHSYAAAEVGFENYAPLVCDFILGSPSSFGHYVGGFLNHLEPGNETTDLHQIGMAGPDLAKPGLVIVTIRLFANRNGPTNYVVVGQLR